MKTLFEQLTEENQNKVLNWKYKALSNAVVNELQSKHFFIEVEMRFALDLHDIIYGQLSYFDINNFIKLFHHENTN